jgi:hypothetical protein
MMADMIVLRAVFDDSDPMADYYHPDRAIFEWYVCDLEGKMVTEAKLRRALKKLPEWLQGLNWKYQKPAKYSMSNHYFGQLRADEGVGLTVKGEHTYSHCDKPLRFILTACSKGIFTINNSLNQQIPQSKELLSQMLEAKQQVWSLRNKQTKEAMEQTVPKIIQESIAIIDEKGFHYLTQEEKCEQTQRFLNKIRMKKDAETKPKTLLDFIT